jgi:hypothetical protein
MFIQAYFFPPSVGIQFVSYYSRVVFLIVAKIDMTIWRSGFATDSFNYIINVTTVYPRSNLRVAVLFIYVKSLMDVVDNPLQRLIQKRIKQELNALYAAHCEGN